MKLTAFKSIPWNKRDNITTLYGVYEKKPFAIAKWQNNSWIVLQPLYGGPLQKDKENIQTGSYKNVNEVLSYFHKQKLSVFCKKEDEASKDTSQSLEGSSEEKRSQKRKYYRKETSLPGEFTNTRTGNQGKIIIKDISFFGVGLITEMPHDFNIDDIINISFELDTPKQPVIHRKIQIKYLNGLKAGGEIVNSPEMDSDLGAYLMP